MKKVYLVTERSKAGAILSRGLVQTNVKVYDYVRQRMAPSRTRYSIWQDFGNRVRSGESKLEIACLPSDTDRESKIQELAQQSIRDGFTLLNMHRGGRNWRNY